MSEEKIVNEEIKAEEIKAEEVISDEELEGVAGGTAREIREDADRLRNLGYLPKNRDVSMNEVNDAFVQLGKDVGLHLGCSLDDDRKNKYYINHDKTPRNEVWSKIYSRLGRGGY